MRQNIFERANRANDRAGWLEYELGDPHRRHLLIRHQGVDSASYVQTMTDSLIYPPPKITSVSPQLVGLSITGGTATNTGITVSANDLLATVSRSTPKALFLPGGTTRAGAWVGMEVRDVRSLSGQRTAEIIYADDSRGLAGDEYRIVHIDDRDCCYWKIILRKLRD